MSAFFGTVFTVGQQVVILFILIGIGFAIRKFHWFDDDGAKQMTKVLLYLVTPSVIIYSFTELDVAGNSFLNLGIAALCALLTHTVGILLASLFFRRDEERRRTILRLNVIFSNCGFLSIPIVQAVAGVGAVAYLSVYIAIFNLLMWTYGVSMFQAEVKSPAKALLNPGVIGLAIGLIVFLLRLYAGFNMPYIAVTPLSSLASLNTPLAMLITGGYLANADLRPRKGDGRMWLSILLRLLAVPAIMLSFFHFLLPAAVAALFPAAALSMSGALLVACTVPAAAPSSTNSILFAVLYDGDVELGSRSVPLANLTSLLTMPVIISLAKLL